MYQQDSIVAGILLFSFSITLVTALKVKINYPVLKKERKTFLNRSKEDKETIDKLEEMQKSFPHLHVSEYPEDDFSHVLGFGDQNYTLSRLQYISKFRIEEVKKNKIPLDVV